MNWSEIDLEGLVDELHATNARRGGAHGAGFEEVLRLVRDDPELLPSLLAAGVSLLAYDEGSSPRTVLEQWFRRSVPDEVWRERYLPLFG